MLSDLYEISILRALREPSHDGWQGAVQLAERTDLPQFKVRAILSALRRRGLVHRGGVTDGRWGEFSLTERGLTELWAADQLRLVK